MKKKDAFKLGLTLLLALTLGACQTNKGSTPAESQPGDASTSEPAGDDSSGGAGDSTSAAGDSTSAADDSSAGGDSSGGAGDSGSEAPQKSITISAVTMVTENNKVYVKVSGTQANYSAAEFKWAWGLKVNGDNGEFIDGKAQPEAADFQAATFDSNNAFEVKYSLSDIENLVSGTFYRVYGGTPESYNDIAFTDQQAGGKDALRSYYLRSDQQYSIVFDARQPVEFTKASIVKITAEDIPAGATATQVGAYVKFGGANLRSYTADDIAALKANGKINGNFQRVIVKSGNAYSKHDHADTERFWKIEGDDLFFYCYVGFIAENEGWMTHFDMVNGNNNANLQFENVIWGEEAYDIDGAIYRVYADSSKSGEANYHGCLGVYREHVHDYKVTATVKNADNKDLNIKSCSCGLKYIEIDFKDYAAISATPDATDPWYLKKDSNVTWNISVDKAIEGAKVEFGMIATSDDHLGRHLYNEYKEDAKHAGEEGYVPQNTAQNPDKDSEAAWRYSVDVGETNYAITNTKTMKENGAKKDVLTYVELATINLAEGNNVLKLTQNNIGYRMRFNGEVRIWFTGNAKIVNPNAHVHSFSPVADGANSDGKVIKNYECSCGGKVAGIAITDAASGADRIESDGKIKTNSTITWKIVAPQAGACTMMMAAKLSSAYLGQNPTPDTPFNSGYSIKAGSTAGTCTIGGKHYESDLNMNGTDYVYFEIGTLTVEAGENVIELKTPSSQNFRACFGGEVRLVFEPAQA